MKRIFVLAMALCMLFSFNANAYDTESEFVNAEGCCSGEVPVFVNEPGCSIVAVGEEPTYEIDREYIENNWATIEAEMFEVISELPDDFANEEGCSIEPVSTNLDSNLYTSPYHMVCGTRSTKVPTDYYNIALDGIYKGAFSGLRGRIYTNYYFDAPNGEYHARVRCYGEYPSLSYVVGNYCINCKKVLATSNTYYTSSSQMTMNEWTDFRITSATSHASHNMCPFVENTSGTINGQMYYISGDIWVNYTDSWT